MNNRILKVIPTVSCDKYYRPACSTPVKTPGVSSRVILFTWMAVSAEPYFTTRAHTVSYSAPFHTKTKNTIH